MFKNLFKKRSILKGINTIQVIGGLIFCFYALYIFFSTWIGYAVSNFALNLFDGALRILSHYYIRNGFIPYKEFGVVYPPGLFILIGKVIPFFSFSQRNLLLSLLLLIPLFFGCLYIYSLTPDKKRYFLYLSLFILINIPILRDIGFSEPLSIPLITILILQTIIYLTEVKTSGLIHLSFFIIPVLVFFLRWERIVMLITVESILLIILLIYNNKLSKYDLKKFRNAISIQILGILGGLVLLILYLYLNQATSAGLDFIFNIPTRVILEYRRLPLPSVQSIFDINFTFYGSLIVYFIYAIQFFLQSKKIVNKSKKIIALFLIVLPFFIISYSLGRADWSHFLPFFYFIGFALLLRCMLYSTPVIVFLLFIILFSPIYRSFYMFDKSLFPIAQDLGDVYINENLKECQSVIAKISDYNTLFIGRINYNRYILNRAILYLLSPNVKPATAFISDEPGVQNSCYYGGIIRAQLEKAEKPMLAFLEEGEDELEQNKTRIMTSCGKIESFLSQKYSEIGQCQAFDRDYKIRLYY